MYTVSDLRHLHLETSTRCNAECPMCARNLFGRTAPGLTETSMDLARLRRCVPDDVLAHIHTVDICGAYGDPAIAPELLDICAHIHATSPTAAIRIYSNGGLRSPDWWARLATIPGVSAIFAIDGLDTNAVYRRKVDTDKALRNAKAFIDAGGHAQWDYIAFAHNEHEIDTPEPAPTSSDSPNSTSRRPPIPAALYNPPPNCAPGTYRRPPSTTAPARSSANYDPCRHAPGQRGLLWAREIEARAEYFDAFFDSCTIRCLASPRPVFISATPRLSLLLDVRPSTLPQLYGPTGAATDPQVRDLLDSAEARHPRRHRHHLEDILSGAFFTPIERSWAADSVAGGKLTVCSRVCGQGFDAYRAQFDRPDLVP
ncbi:Uncharacterised protein [Nocardia otitidiscaviarum]|uniref:Radical SAM protein n=1 Tax=Nocardia otitidiscaviarum TaxID=1823 RepID=A0A379JLX1_9NOCA|nr:radical SAM protein [Nocardia otitidiscaviarum]SUD49505.1 Uncharacterised protein [Nocardia otitidiscaviarum]